ncbi:helix-turn-helix transcriptional regulator [Escherichia coli]|nr:helix-turn-helix transcriptional regulator [Escherichia coli]
MSLAIKKLKINNNEHYLIEKNNIMTVERMKSLSASTPEYIELSQEEVNDIIKIMSPLYCKHERPEKIYENVFSIESDALSKELFDAIKKTKNYRLKIYKLACLLSKAKNPQGLFNSLFISTAVLFSDKVRKVIESDISKKWKLSSIAAEFHLSEIAIRKKLSSEKTTFYRILLDVRMEKAAILIMKNEFQIRNVSNMVGISSPSHFIKKFQSYYGLTPKKFIMLHRA